MGENDNDEDGADLCVAIATLPLYVLSLHYIISIVKEIPEQKKQPPIV